MAGKILLLMSMRRYKNCVTFCSHFFAKKLIGACSPGLSSWFLQGTLVMSNDVEMALTLKPVVCCNDVWNIRGLHRTKGDDGANNLRRKLSQGEESSLSGFDCWGQALAMARENVIERALSGRTIGGSGWVWPNSEFEGKNWRFSTAAPACSWCVHIKKMWVRDHKSKGEWFNWGSNPICFKRCCLSLRASLLVNCSEANPKKHWMWDEQATG